MKQMSKMEKKLFTSSLNICQEGDGTEQNLSPHHHPIPRLIWDTLFKDDVTFISPLGVSFMTIALLQPE
jgi:hypothetical protein